jgi:hypothetical protein
MCLSNHTPSRRFTSGPSIRKEMRTVRHDPNSFREPIGFVDTLALLTLTSAICLTVFTLVAAGVALLP